MLSSKDAFLQLVRLGIGLQVDRHLRGVEWNEIEVLANRHGLMGVVLDGVRQLSGDQCPPQEQWLRWIGQVMLEEQRFAQQWQASCMMSQLFARNNVRTYVLKGMVVSECYPKPQHRVSSDVDCFLIPAEGDFDAWEKGNQLMEEAGYKVSRGFYKNSSYRLQGLTIENHRFMVPFRANERLERLERLLQSVMRNETDGLSHKGNRLGVQYDGTELWKPPVMGSALFLVEHAYSHFLHEGLTWRHVLDWMMFSRKHKMEIDWNTFDVWIDEYGFRKFYDSYTRLGQYLLGEIKDIELDKQDKLMLEDVWAELDLHDTLHGIKGKLGLVGNTLRARWKYQYFAEISMFQALWIQVKGFLFYKHPKLELN